MKSLPVRNLLEAGFAIASATNIVPAVGIAGFGVAVCLLIGLDLAYFPILWLAGGLLVYNIDRGYGCDADAANTPRRMQHGRQFAQARAAAIIIAAISLLAAPIVARDWHVLALMLAGALCCVNYSVHVPGFTRRWKDVPVAKSLFPPLAITVALLAPPLAAAAQWPSADQLLLWAAWVYACLLFNVVLFDLRDLDGDRTAGTRTLAVVLGRRRTNVFLAALLGSITMLSLALCRLHPAPLLALVSAGVVAYFLAVLALQTRQRPAEWFYEWCVDGGLLLPGAAILLLRTAG
jgi:4-hydroxybenzoate polyprenyltransferase